MADEVEYVVPDADLSSPERTELIPDNHPMRLHQEEINSFAIVEGIDGKNLAFKALGSRVIIVEDKFRTGSECPTCNGERLESQKCPKCLGTGKNRFDSECGECDGRGTVIPVCATCKGTGVKSGSIVVVRQSEAPPTSGKIVSVGPLVKYLKVGDRVAYANYTGVKITFKQQGIMRVMHEDEISLLVFGSGQIGDNLS